MTGWEREWLIDFSKRKDLMSHDFFENHLADRAPRAWGKVRARAKVLGFDWATLFELLLKYGPIIFQMIIDFINGMTKAELVEKYGDGAAGIIDDVLNRVPPGVPTS